MLSLYKIQIRLKDKVFFESLQIGEYFIKTSLNLKNRISFDRKMNKTFYCNACLKTSEFDIVTINSEGIVLRTNFSFYGLTKEQNFKNYTILRPFCEDCKKQGDIIKDLINCHPWDLQRILQEKIFSLNQQKQILQLQIQAIKIDLLDQQENSIKQQQTIADTQEIFFNPMIDNVLNHLQNCFTPCRQLFPKMTLHIYELRAAIRSENHFTFLESLNSYLKTKIKEIAMLIEEKKKLINQLQKERYKYANPSLTKPNQLAQTIQFNLQSCYSQNLQSATKELNQLHDLICKCCLIREWIMKELLALIFQNQGQCQ